jgi:heme/copper-type cytochrome/quinol oxidase subunit 2
MFLLYFSVIYEIKRHLQFTGNRTARVLAIILLIVVMILGTVVVFYCLWRRRKKPAEKTLLIGK